VTPVVERLLEELEEIGQVIDRIVVCLVLVDTEYQSCEYEPKILSWFERMKLSSGQSFPFCSFTTACP
jgi:hypothetical protein